MQHSQDHSVHDVLENNLFTVYLGNSSRPFARFHSSCSNQPNPPPPKKSSDLRKSHGSSLRGLKIRTSLTFTSLSFFMYGGYFMYVTVYLQQQYFLHAHSNMSLDVLAVASLGTSSATAAYSAKIINIATYLPC